MRTLKGLYALTPDLDDTMRLMQMAEQCLEGGAHLLQYRNKQADENLQRQQAESLLKLCRKFSAPLIINDNPRLAAAIDADGVHLGREDGAIGSARKLLGAEKIIGVSCYGNLQSALDAQQQGADYVAFGSFFASPTKPEATPASLALLSNAKQALRIPLVAIGGITLANAPALIAAGADAVAVISAVFGAHDIAAATRDFAGLFTQNISTLKQKAHS